MVSYKARSPENPVGPDIPLVRNRIPTWQVLLVLFAIAVALTAYQYYQREFIAPAQPIDWQEFSTITYRTARQQRRPVLVMVRSEDSQRQATLTSATDQAEVRKQIYLFGVAALAGKMATVRDVARTELQAASGVDGDLIRSQGGFLIIVGDAPPQVVFLSAAEATGAKLASLLEEGVRDE